MKRSATMYPPVAMVLVLFEHLLVFPQSEPQSTKKTYQPNGSEGSLAGTVSLSGTAPWPMRIDMSADPVCHENNPKPLTEFIVAKDGRLANVLVYVKSGDLLEGLSFETPTTSAVLDQHGCRYLPHVLGVQVNQTLEIRNSDKTIQNVHAMPKNDPDWNQSHAPLSEPLTHRFKHAEIAVPFKDNLHPWKKAYVGVFTHPFFSVSNRKGVFTIEGLPPGNYTIGVWHEEFGEKTLEVTIYPGSHQSLDISFDMAERKVLH